MLYPFLAALVMAAAQSAPAAAMPWPPAWPEPLWNYEDAYLAAAADIRPFPKRDGYYIRYLDRGFLPARLREEMGQVLSFHVNSISLRSKIRPPFPVPGSRGNLYRIDLRWYGWDPRTFGRLANTYPYGSVTLKKGKDSIRAIAFWNGETPAGKEALGYVAARTNSRVPVVRADWFFWQTASAFDRDDDNPGYYEFQGIKDQKTFEKLVGFDAKATALFSEELRAAIGKSGVSIQPRRVVRSDKPGGAIWYALDNKKATGVRNPVDNLNGGFDYDAAEGYAHGSNGLWKCVLVNRQGVLQQTAPDFIGYHHGAYGNDGKIHNYISCVSCHEEGGLRPLDDWARRIYTSPLVLQDRRGKTAEEILRLEEQYFRDLGVFLRRDRQVYEEALAECNGLGSAKNARAASEVWGYYADEGVGLERAARDCGLTPAEFVGGLERYLKTYGQLSPMISMFLKPANRQLPIGIDQWHDLFPSVMLVVRNLQPVDLDKLYGDNPN